MTLLGEGVAAETVTNVIVRVPPPYARMIATRPEAGARASTIVSAAFQMGLAVHRPDRLYDIERDGAMDETAALQFAQMVEITADESLLEFFPDSFPAEVEVMAGGQIRSKRITAAYGDPSRPLDDAKLRYKAERILGETTTVQIGLAGLDSDAGCRALADAIWNACLQ
jgi:2-methylcitrate dehydratase PrpD